MTKRRSRLPQRMTCDLPNWRRHTRLVSELLQFYRLAQAAFPDTRLAVDLNFDMARVRVDLIEGPFDSLEFMEDHPDGDRWFYFDSEHDLDELRHLGELGQNIALLARLTQRFLHDPRSHIREKLRRHSEEAGEPEFDGKVSLVIGMSEYQKSFVELPRAAIPGTVTLKTEELVALYRAAAWQIGAQHLQ